MVKLIRNGSIVEIQVGSVKLLTLNVRHRTQSNGYRRNRNQAVYVEMFHPIVEWTKAGNAASIPQVMKMLTDLGVEPDIFLDTCVDEGWGDEVPSKNQMKMVL